MKNKIILEELSSKVSLLLERYNREKEKNKQLSEELFLLKNKLEEQKEKLTLLEENVRLSDMERDNIAQKTGELLT
jgi:hypothetical protein